jgi:hypothetical protein
VLASKDTLVYHGCGVRSAGGKLRFIISKKRELTHQLTIKKRDGRGVEYRIFSKKIGRKVYFC